MNKVNDSEIGLTLLTTNTQKQAAAKLGISEQTLIKRMKSPDFQKEYEKLRRKTFDVSFSELVKASNQAVEVLQELMNSKKEYIRYKAASKIIELTTNAIVINDIAKRIDQLENNMVS